MVDATTYRDVGTVASAGPAGANATAAAPGASASAGSAVDLFALKDAKGPILYAPLGQLMARANGPAVAAALAYADDPTSFENMTPDEQAVVEAFKERGFFERRQLPTHERGFQPVQVTLFPTNRCNLRCSYCYAFGGEGGGNGEPLVTMRPAVAHAAIDLVADNARRLADEGQNIQGFIVSIHGNGEPFCAFGLMQDIVNYGRAASERVGVPVVFNTATNGVLTEAQLEFLVQNFDSANISFDGLPEFQDANRPIAGGGGSFSQIDRTMRRLAEEGVSFGIRTTVTADMVERMPDIVSFVADNYPRVEQIHFEPVWECGRCATSADTMPTAEAFTRSYLAALDVAEKRGVRLVYSGARQNMVTDVFCKVGGGGFTVTPAGDASACYEVSYRSDPRSERFFFGRFDEAEGAFAFDAGKLDELSLLNVHNFPYCRDCFCKWHCAGDCAAKVLEGIRPDQHAGSVRCDVNRALTLDQIQRRLNWQPWEEEDDHGQQNL